jgi:hypothetical protein
VVFILLLVITVVVANHPDLYEPVAPPQPVEVSSQAESSVLTELSLLPVKGRAPKTGYERTLFGDGWRRVGNCDMRNIILNRDLTQVAVDDRCRVLTGVLNDPYTGKVIQFQRGELSSQIVQIDHVVSLSNAWQTGAQQLTPVERENLANDPLNLLAVDGAINQQKGDGDAATWLPPNKAFRCQYVERQVMTKKNYRLWVTPAEKDAMSTVLSRC